MHKRKLLISTAAIFGVAAVATAVGVGYSFNKSTSAFSNYYSSPQSISTSDLIQAYFAAAVNGAKMIYLASDTHTIPLSQALNITKAENAPKYNYFSKTGYLLIDDIYGFPSFDEETGLIDLNNPALWSTNVASVQFRTDLGSFITGIALGQFLNENRDYFGENLTWATYGGVPFGSVPPFMGGFQKGVEWFNENVVPKNPEFTRVQQAFVGETGETNFANGFAPNQGDDIINNLLNKDISALIPVAGPQTQQAVRLIAQRQERTIVIGVDGPMEDDSTINSEMIGLKNDQTVGNNKIIQFSSIKNVNQMVYDITNIINDGVKDPQNNIGGIGYSSLGTLSNGGVGVSESGIPYFVKAFKLFENTQSWEEIKESVNNMDLAQLNDEYRLSLNNTGFKSFLDSLDLPENKTFLIPGDESVSYASLPNTGSSMFPIIQALENPDVIQTWFNQHYPNDPNATQNINDLKTWVLENQEAIELRKTLDLTNNFNVEDIQRNPRITKIISQSPTSILFDHSFLESCYIGLRDYWLSKGISLPRPPSLTNRASLFVKGSKDEK